MPLSKRLICLNVSFFLLFLPALSDADTPSIVVNSEPFRVADVCTDTFVLHELDHITTVSKEPVSYYESNGAGLAINDLNNDGYLDVVLANLAGDNAIFWNEGNLEFQKQPLRSISAARAVAIVDVDGDSWLDIVFTQQIAAPLYWHNLAGAGFASKILRGVSYPGYAMTWADMDSDGDLDLITGSYDAELIKLRGPSSQTAGVIYYENEGSRFSATRLAIEAHALALNLHDVNQDGIIDVIVGNDFSFEDQYFSYINGNWQELEPLSVMPYSTMSYAAADINNSGQLEIYAVDMKPYSDDPATMTAWEPILEMMMRLPRNVNDPQIMENVLYGLDGSGTLMNRAPELNLSATGWSWSAKFGDLDNDGFQDLYVVNGMIAIELFPQLPNDELVEENRTFHNVEGRMFVPIDEWGLNSTSSGRGMSMADLDNDGDLDIVINNLMSNAVVYENQVCNGESIEVDLRWPSSQNTYAVGSQVYLYTTNGTYRRDVTVSSGYLSGDPSRLHFGFPADTELSHLTIVWSDGEDSTITNISGNSYIMIHRE